MLLMKINTITMYRPKVDEERRKGGDINEIRFWSTRGPFWAMSDTCFFSSIVVFDGPNYVL